MIKHISIIYRPPNLSHEQTVKYWKEVHQNVVKQRLPGLRKYVGNFPVQPPDSSENQPGGGQQMQCDAIVELHFDDLASLQKAMTAPDWLSHERQKSNSNVIDYKRLQYVVVEEVASLDRSDHRL